MVSSHSEVGWDPVTGECRMQSTRINISEACLQGWELPTLPSLRSSGSNSNDEFVNVAIPFVIHVRLASGVMSNL